jgi:hypothetical protein
MDNSEPAHSPPVDKAFVVTAWNMFCYIRRESLRQQHPTLQGRQITSLLSCEWQRMDPCSRQYFASLAMRFRGCPEPTIPAADVPSPTRPIIPECLRAEAEAPALYLPELPVVERKRFGAAAAVASQTWLRA